MGHRTETTLLKLTDHITEGINQKVTLLLFFEFSKAFDSVCHATQLRKLKELGLAKSAIKWIASHLAGREQAVLDFTGQPSSFAKLNTGVPQGSVLGSLLFALYTWDISLGFSKEFLHLIYADDLQLYVKFPLAMIHQFFERMSENAELLSI